MDKAIALKTKGDTEFCLYRWADGDWTAHIGNPSQWVAMLEAGSQFTGKGATPEEAVESLIAVMEARADGQRNA